MSTIKQDIRTSATALLRAKKYSLMIISCLALGLGVNAAMFSIGDTLFLRAPVGVRQADRITRFYFDRNVPVAGKILVDVISYPIFGDMAARSHSFAGLAAYSSTSVGVGLGANAAKLHAALVSGSYFDVVGARVSIGRTILRSDDILSALPVVVISHGLWDSRFNHRADVIGERLAIAGRSYVIVGVAERGFGGLDQDPVDIWLPISSASDDLIMPRFVQNRGAMVLSLVGRLASKVDVRTAEREATQVFRDVMRGSPRFDPADHVLLASLLRERGPKATDVGNVTTWLLGLSFAVLCIACANCASLILLRVLRRQDEFAIRVALGGSAFRLMRIVLFESALIALCAAGASIIVAFLTDRTLIPLLLGDGSLSTGRELLRLSLYTFLAALIAVLLMTTPALFVASRAGGQRILRPDVRSASIGHRQFQVALLVCQIALTMLLVMGAGLFVQSFINTRRLDLGFVPDGVLAVNIGIDGFTARDTTGLQSHLVTRVADQIRTLGGVSGVAVATSVPFQKSTPTQFLIPGRDSASVARQAAFMTVATQQYRSVLGLRVLSGRWFDSSDYEAAGTALVINETMASRFWPRQSALGNCVVVGEDQCRQIVGVVADVRQRELREEPRPQIYLPETTNHLADRHFSRTVLLRSSNSTALLQTLRPVLQAAVPGLPYVTVSSLSELARGKARSWELGAVIFSLFGVLALVLAALGMYGTIGAFVEQRTHEFSIRLAMGASPAALIRLVGRHATLIVLSGIGAGVLIALAGLKSIEQLLFGVHAGSVATFTTCAVVVTIAAAVACIPPVVRAVRTSPAAVLRS